MLLSWISIKDLLVQAADPAAGRGQPDCAPPRKGPGRRAFCPLYCSAAPLDKEGWNPNDGYNRKIEPIGGSPMFSPLLTGVVCVADSGSFNQAAEKLSISSAAVIKQINSLEKHLDLKLFERTNHGIRLTAAGQVIYRYAKQMFTLSEQAITQAR